MKHIVKTTVSISVLTFLSRVLGVVRDSLIAMMFGTSAATDAFFIVFRPFDLVRKLFSEGVFNVSFIPTFSNVLTGQGQKKAVEVAYNIFLVLSFVGVLLTLVCFICTPVLLKFMAPGYAGESYEYRLAMVLFQLMLPYFAFIMITALCMAVLNTFERFIIPGLSPLIFNIVIISFTLFVSRLTNPPIYALALGVTAGGAIQLFVQWAAVRKIKLPKPVVSNIFNKEAFHICKIMLPCMVGAASYQINMVVASFFASQLSEGSVSYLYFSDRLVQFPLALFAVSAATVFLPELSKQAAAKDYEKMGQLFGNGLKLVLFLTIPAIAGMMALHEQIVALLFQRGLFDAVAVGQTGRCTYFLVTGLWIFTCSRFFVTLHFSLKSVRIPFYSGLLSIFSNIWLAFWLMPRYGLNGLVCAMILSAFLGFCYLFLQTPGIIRLKRFDILVSACRSVFLSVIMFFLVRSAAVWIPDRHLNHSGFAAMTMACIVIGILFYLGANYAFSNPELGMIFDKKKYKRQ